MTFDPAAMFAVLNAHDVQYVVIGGMGARYQGSDLLTEDVDITPDLEPANLDRLANALVALEAKMLDPDGKPIDLPEPKIEPELMMRMRSFRTTTRSGVLDISLHPDGTDGFPDLVRRAVYIVVDTVAAPVADLRDIIRSKDAAGRDKDLAALPHLERVLARQQREGPAREIRLPVDPARYIGD